jgi:hypothetical protein
MQRVKIPDLMEAANWLGWAFWFAWVLANSVGWIVGMSLAWLLSVIIPPLSAGTWTASVWTVGGMIVGTNLGINQWFLLRPLRYGTLGRRANWWVAATIFGWAISLLVVVGLGLGARIGYPLVGLVIGLAVGIPQTFVLSIQNRLGWLWPIAHSLAWVIGLSTIPVFDEAVGFPIVGLVSGAISGAALIRIIGSEPDAA